MTQEKVKDMRSSDDWLVLEGEHHKAVVVVPSQARLTPRYLRSKTNPYTMNGIDTASTTPLSRAIPSRRIPVHDPSQMPMDYSTTPGGTIYSTTPGGTRIIYERKFLMELRNSPLSKTPPVNLPFIPGVTCEENAKVEENEKPVSVPEQKADAGDEPQFQMEI